METTQDEGLVNKPHVLNGANYDYLNTMMVDFLKSLGNKNWKYVIKGWRHPVITSKDDTTSLKPEADWTKVKNDKALGNSKALNAILKRVDKNMLRLISTCS